MSLRLPKEFRADARKVITDVVQTHAPATDLEKDQGLVSKLDYNIWLPFAAKTYNISARIEDYVVIPTPVCPSDLPNRNGIGFPLSELTRYMPPPIARQVFKAWTGTPLHVEHDNKDCTKAFGVVLDSMLTLITGYNGDRMWKVMGLAAIDKNKAPDLAQQALDNEFNTFSMGALADELRCSICHSVVYDEKNRHKNCRHTTHTEDINFRVFDVDGKRRLGYLTAHYLTPIELSYVADPAWVPALSDQVLMGG